MRKTRLAKVARKEKKIIRRFIERMKEKAEQKRLAKLRGGVRNEGEEILGAERCSENKLHLQAARAWISVGMPERALGELRKSGFEPSVARLCAEYGLESKLAGMVYGLAQDGNLLAASNLAHIGGMTEQAVAFGYDHMTSGSMEMPEVFAESPKILKRIAEEFEGEGNFGAAGRAYERINLRKKAAEAYLRGGHLDEFDRMLKKNSDFIHGSGVAKLAFKAAIESGKPEYADKLVDEHPRAYSGYFDSRTIAKSMLHGGLAAGIATAVIISLGGGVMEIILPASLVFVLATFASAAISASKSNNKEWVFNTLKDEIAREPSGTKLDRAKLPPYPALAGGDGDVRALPEHEEADRFLDAGNAYEAGMMYARMGYSAKEALDCACAMEKEGKLEEARRIRVLVFGKGLLVAEEMARENPDAAREILKWMGISPPEEDARKN